MNYLIMSQKNRRVEEILYDHNTENMQVSIMDEMRESEMLEGFKETVDQKPRRTTISGNFYRRREK